MTHHVFMTSSLLIKILKIDNFGDVSCDIDYNSRTGVFRDVISLIINQCDPRRPKGASGGPPAAQRKQAKRACNQKLMTPQSIMTQSLRFKNLRNDKSDDFWSDIDYNSKTHIFRDVISLIINHCVPTMDTKCPPTAQCKQAKRVILTIKTRLIYIYLFIYIYLYICNELIEETASHKKLFWHVGVFWLWLH